MPKLRNIDEYIAQAPAYSRPILKKLRSLYRRASPKIVERIKWRAPSFEYRGMVGGLVAGEKYVSWGLWKARLLKDPHKAIRSRELAPASAGRASKLSDLPPDKVLIDLIKQAVALNEPLPNKPPRQRVARPMPDTPRDLEAALKKSPRAAKTFERFTPSNQREYIEWITTSRSDETRQRRLAVAIKWMNQGKPRYWKAMMR